MEAILKYRVQINNQFVVFGIVTPEGLVGMDTNIWDAYFPPCSITEAYILYFLILKWKPIVFIFLIDLNKCLLYFC
jgi:hypothetical protein